MAGDLEAIVQKMIDAGEPEENIATVIKEYSSMNQPAAPKPAPTTYADEPTTFAGGVLNSLNPFGSASALKASGQGLMGYMKGAVADLPSSLGGMASDFASSVMNPVDTIKNTPYALGGIKDIGNSIADTTMKAGSDPNAFGEMVGQYTGQPLVTEGLAKGVPAAVRGAPAVADKAAEFAAQIPGVKKAINAVGRPVEAAGNIGKRYGTVTGMMPPFATPRLVRAADRMVGSGIETIGKKMRNFGKVAETGSEEIPRSMPSIEDLGNAPTVTDLGNITEDSPIMQGQLGEPGARFTGDIFGNNADLANPEQKTTTALAKRQNTSISRRGGSVTDESGREIAPPQAEIKERPAGPWDKNKGQTPVEKPITAESFGPGFFKNQGGLTTAKLNTKFATPQIVEGLKSQGFKFAGLDEKGKMIFQRSQ